MKTCYIFAAAKGEPTKFTPCKDDLIIAADGGFLKLKNYSTEPHIVLGDFDSLEEIPTHSNVIKHPVKKDDTDTLLAVKTGFEQGYNRFVIYGGTGGRLDHTFANLQTLSFIAQKSGTGFLCGEGFVATAVSNSVISFKESAKGNISVFSLSNECEVTIEGLLYTLKNAAVTNNFPIGVSNEFIGKTAKISVQNGTALIIWSGDLDDILD